MKSFMLVLQILCGSAAAGDLRDAFPLARRSKPHEVDAHKGLGDTFWTHLTSDFRAFEV